MSLATTAFPIQGPLPSPKSKVDAGGIMLMPTNEIRPHPSILQHKLAPAMAKVSILADRGDRAFQEPLIITTDGIILDGFARWSLAKRQGRQELPCIVRQMDQSAALVCILQKHRQTISLNDFLRVSLALSLEPHFREQARERQRLGGGRKLSSNLTEDERIDVRAKIAEVAGVCVANVTKGKRLIESADMAVLTALQVGEIRMHRAWTWLENSKDGGFQDYNNFRNENGIRRKIRELISQQVQHQSRLPKELHRLNKVVAELSLKPQFRDLARTLEEIIHATPTSRSPEKDQCAHA